jgi:hypothetical protein
VGGGNGSTWLFVYIDGKKVNQRYSYLVSSIYYTRHITYVRAYENFFTCIISGSGS